MSSVPTWEISRSMAFELDVLCTMLNDYLPRASLSPRLNTLLDQVPSAWRSDVHALLGEGKHFYTLFVPAAFAAGTLLEEDYVAATLPMRQMTVEDCTARTITRAAEYGLTLKRDPAQPAAEQFKQVQMDLLDQMSARYAYPYADAGTRLFLQADLDLLQRILMGGDLHARFWLWLDRLYYQVYQPWRHTHEDAMRLQEEHARLALGVPGTPLPLDWLPGVNTLRSAHEMTAAVLERGLHIIFISEPFDMGDASLLMPPGLMITFASSEDLYSNFYRFVDGLSLRLKALADPTRLTILRIIRTSAKDNTDIASYLGISRPTVSIHARQLREAGLIHTVENGRSVRHEINAAELRQLFHDLERFLDLPLEE